jgi:rod shape determining protein RodA
MSLVSHRWRDFDIPLAATAIVLMCFGVVAIWSARGGGDLTLENEGIRQAVFGIAGVALMLIVAGMDYRFLASLSWIIYFAALALLALVLVPGVGVEILGSRRWFQLGSLTVQPSEFGKLATIICLGAFIASRGREMRLLGNFLVSLLIAAAPAALVFREPDLGTTTVYGAIWAAMMLVAAVRWVHLAGLALMAIPSTVVAWFFLLHDYQRERLLISFNPEADPTGAGYNILQARMSIGSGGLFGSGLQGGTQSRLELLKVRESDFIFAHASGMVGFVGIMGLFACYILLLWRCLRVVETARDTFGQCVAIGVTAALFYQAFVNMGMNMGIMPVTGITLPLVSQGTSSLWTFLISLGLLQSILMHHRKLAFQPE